MKKPEKIVDIVQLPNPVLREQSLDVPIPLTDEDIQLAETMIEHIDFSQEPNQEIYRPGVGVAAVQYGILKNVFYVCVKGSKKNYLFRDVLFNPKIIKTSKHKQAIYYGEGCLSVPEEWPNQKGYVPRAAKITVHAYSYNERKYKTFNLSDFVAIVFQHELDHLAGKLFIDRINQKDPFKQLPNLTFLK